MPDRGPIRPKKAAEQALKSFAKGDPNQRIAGFLGRFFRPVLLVVGGLAAMAVGRWLGEGSQIGRLGVTVLIIGVLWTVAVGFALGTLRLASAIALGVIVFLLTAVGGDVRRDQDAQGYVALRNELEIEFNLLSGSRTTRAQVAERLVASATSQLEGERYVVAARLVEQKMVGWMHEVGFSSDTKPLIDAHRRHLRDVREELRELLEPTREAVENAWETLDVAGPGPFDEADGQASAPAERSEEAAPDDRADEPVDAEVRNQLDLAERSARSVDAAVDEVTQAFFQAGYTEAANQVGDVGDRSVAAGKLKLPSIADEGSGVFTCTETPPNTSNFDQVLGFANGCVAGCQAPEGPCEPQTAKRVLLLGFQSRLADFTESEDVGGAQEELLGRLGEVQAELDELQNPVALHRLAMVGADEVLGDLARSLVLDDERPARLGGWGWLVLTVAAVVGYRLLEVANARRSPSPVSVVAGEASDGSKAKTAAAAALVRAHLGAASLQEPSPLPGGDAVASVSKSAESAGFENDVIRYVVGLLQSTAFPRRGVELVVTAQPARSGLTATTASDDTSEGQQASEGGAAETNGATDRVNENGHDGGDEAGEGSSDEPDGRYRLMVRASTSHRQGLIFSHPFEGKTLDEVSHAAAYFAAERLLDSGWTTPSWLIWSSQDGTALRAYQKVMIEKSNPLRLHRSGEPASVAPAGRDRGLLKKAVRASPGTGAALVALSHEEVLDGDMTDALHHLLLARARHQRFLTVRYRLGVTLSMMANNIDQHWKSNDLDGWWIEPPIAGAMDELERLRGGQKLPRIEHPNRLRDVLLHQAIRELRFVERSVRLPVVLWRTRRQSEREYWLGVAKSSRRRRGLAATALAARALAVRRREHVLASQESTVPRSWRDRRSRGALKHTDKMISRALRKSPDDWLVRYNAACYYAALAKEAETEQRRHLAAGQTPPPPNEEVRDYRREAFAQLRRARYARNGQQLSVGWACVDPDLRPLRDACGGLEPWRERLTRVFDLDEAALASADEPPAAWDSTITPDEPEGARPSLLATIRRKMRV